MPKKTLFKVTALVVCIAFLALSVPTMYAKPRADKLDVGTFFKKQIAFFSSLLSFLPLFNNGNGYDQHSEDIVQKVKVTGNLDSTRGSGGD